jgi:hypothetical protein
MPAKPAHEPEPDATPAPAKTTDTAAAAPDKPETDAVPDGRLPAGVYEFTGPIATQYLEVPLTARPADPGRPATDDEPAVAPTPATVFDWTLSAPGDGRWAPTKKKPNSLPDNAPALPEE